jgi:hypothetical protein
MQLRAFAHWDREIRPTAPVLQMQFIPARAVSIAVTSSGLRSCKSTFEFADEDANLRVNLALVFNFLDYRYAISASMPCRTILQTFC